MIAFERAIHLEGPGSSHRERGTAIAANIFEHYPAAYDRQHSHLQTSRNPAETIDRIRSVVRAGDLLIVGTGDGGLAKALEAIEGNAEITALPTHSGNGNDAACDLIGPYNTLSPKETLKQGTVVPVHLTDIVINGIIHKMLNYFELGSNPKGAKLLNSAGWRSLPGYRHDWLRSAYEYAALPPLAFFSRRFSLTQDEQTRKLVNLSVVHSHTAAKHARMPVSLTKTPAIFNRGRHAAPFATMGHSSCPRNTTGRIPATKRTTAYGTWPAGAVPYRCRIPLCPNWQQYCYCTIHAKRPSGHTAQITYSS